MRDEEGLPCADDHSVGIKDTFMLKHKSHYHPHTIFQAEYDRTSRSHSHRPLSGPSGLMSNARGSGSLVSRGGTGPQGISRASTASPSFLNSSVISTGQGSHAADKRMSSSVEFVRLSSTLPAGVGGGNFAVSTPTRPKTAGACATPSSLRKQSEPSRKVGKQGNELGPGIFIESQTNLKHISFAPEKSLESSESKDKDKDAHSVCGGSAIMGMSLLRQTRVPSFTYAPPPVGKPLNSSSLLVAANGVTGNKPVGKLRTFKSASGEGVSINRVGGRPCSAQAGPHLHLTATSSPSNCLDHIARRIV